MKSVGEAMSIGGNFQESIQKGLRSLENDLEGFNELSEKGFTKEEIKKNLKIACPERLLYIAEAFRSGLTVEEVNSITFYDPWFLRQIEEIIMWEKLIQKDGLPEDKENFKLIKSMGEKCKVSIRNIRRDANDELKKLLKLKEIGEDEEKTFEKNVQNITDKHILLVDEKVSIKEKEIMTI